jgi:hypothetical protein
MSNVVPEKITFLVSIKIIFRINYVQNFRAQQYFGTFQNGNKRLLKNWGPK